MTVANDMDLKTDQTDLKEPVPRVVLLVEDQVQVRATLERALRMSGYTVLLASDTMTARAMIEHHAPDVLVTDVALGTGSDGYELLVWSRSAWPELPVVLISGLAPPDLFADQVTGRHVRFLAKPFSLAALLEAVTAVLTI